MKKITILLLLVMVLSSCSPNDGASPSIADIPPMTISEEVIEVKQPLIEFANEFAKDQIAQSPLNASFTYGDLNEEGLGYLLYELDDGTLTSSLETIEDYKLIEEELFSYDYEALTYEEKKIYDLLAFQLEVAITGEDYLLYYNSFNPSFGLQVTLPLTLAQIELETAEEVEAFMVRLEKVPQLMDEAIATEKLKAEKKLLLPEALYQGTIEQIEEIIGNGPENFMVYLSFEDRMEEADFLSDEDKESYLETCFEIVEEKILPSYEMAAKELRRIKAFDGNTLGTSEWQDYEAYYEWLLFQNTSYKMTVTEMRRWLKYEIKEAEDELVDYISTHPSIFEKFGPLGEVQFDSIEDAYDASREVYKSHFNDYGVSLAQEAIIPAYLEAYLPGGFYFPTSIDWQDYGTMFLPEDSYTDLTIDEFTTLLHENVPGHHMYFSILYNSDLPFVQKMSDWDTYSEGWAVYVADYGFEAIDLDQEVVDYLKIFFKIVYMEDLLRDIKIHVDGMPKDEVIEELMAYGGTYENAQKSYNRMLANPGEVYQYYYGYLKISDYRDMYEESYQDSFDEKAFHDFMLEHINLPFTTMDRLVENALSIDL